MASKTSIDFSKYRTTELVDTIVELVSLPNAVRGILKSGLFGVVIAVICVVVLLILTGDFNIVWSTLLGAYAVPAGVAGGLAFGIAGFIRKSFDNMSLLVDLLFNLTRQIVNDAGDVFGGKTQLPNARDLVSEVYNQILLQSLKQAINSNFGWFGPPIFAAYRLTLNRLVRQAIRLIPKKHQDLEDATTVIKSSVETVTTNESQIVANLETAQKRLGSLSGTIKTLVLWPCYAILALVLTTLVTPIVLVWFFILR